MGAANAKEASANASSASGMDESDTGPLPTPLAPNTVVLHEVGRWRHSPNASFFCVKLEAWLRMARLPYVVAYGRKFSRKGKIPWIEYNGEQVDDSHMIIKYLVTKSGVDPDAWLTEEQRATGHVLMRTLEERTYFVVVYMRWLVHTDTTLHDVLHIDGTVTRAIVRAVARKRVGTMLNGQGVGRHSPDEANALAIEDMTAADALLSADRPFLFGDRMCQADIVLFATTGSIVDCDYATCALKTFVESRPKLMAHYRKIRNALWPNDAEYTKGRRQWSPPADTGVSAAAAATSSSGEQPTSA